MKKEVDWDAEYRNRSRERLQKASALNRLGQDNYGGVQRSPVRSAPAQSMSQPPNKPWPKPTRW